LSLELKMFELKLSFESPVIVNVLDTSESYRVSEWGARGLIFGKFQHNFAPCSLIVNFSLYCLIFVVSGQAVSYPTVLFIFWTIEFLLKSITAILFQLLSNRQPFLQS
ncbi:hypothetical protein, partial [Dulcicalothrix desertica]|uniref:hypothetical protein n=1 Tax=Dulcicalothrix desertica TaxID=32056 RepID=UPI001C999370